MIDVSNNDWKVCIIYDPTDKLDHQHISFVNGISTTRGGTHVDHVVNQIVNKLKDTITKKAKTITIKPSMIKENLIFFIDCVLVNPEFDTQTKEMLKTKVSDFSTTYNVSDTVLKKIMSTGVIDQIIANAQAKAEANLQKSGKTRNTFDKLYPAHKANTKDGYKCTLILTEGDSAKTFAMSGLNVIGRDYYGVFPLRGKPLNVSDASATDVVNNKEITAITQIIGLEHKRVYNDTKGLRYGSILILTDQDHDGSHIKGLIMNFIHHFWPSLARLEGFIRSLHTPLLKITRGKGKKAEILQFTSQNEYDLWKNQHSNEKGWSEPKYYKGLGTSTAKEAQECFEDIDEKFITYFWKTNIDKNRKNNSNDDSKKNDSKDDSKKNNKSKFIDTTSDLVSETYKPKCKDICEDAIKLAFNKERADDRKRWLNTYDPNNFIDGSEKKYHIMILFIDN